MPKGKLVIDVDCGGYFVTPESNYNARIRNERKVTRAGDFDSAQEVIDYFCKYFGSSPSDFLIMSD